MKSTVEEIRQRFDNDVERFSNLEAGHAAAVDSPLIMDLITRAAAACTPHAADLLDIGCGAGNYALKMLECVPNLNVSLLDLSQPMLERAAQRVGAVTSGRVVTHQADIRDLELGDGQFDIILAAAVFHHLRAGEEWRAVFAKCLRALRPGGSLWISDMVEHGHPPIQSLMKSRYGEYLSAQKGDEYRETVFAYIEKEDTPRPLLFQVDLLREVGFSTVEILHKNSVFAAFGGMRGG
jgi:tRNA (cmo5U34)-methyltransferase